MRIWNYSRNQTEIQSTMNSELYGNEIGLVGYWKFNEQLGLIAYDATSNSNNANLSGDASFVSSSAPVNQITTQNNAIAFDGSGDYIEIPYSNNWEFGTDDFTIAFWMTLDNLSLVHDGLFGRNDFQWIAMEYNHDSDHRLNLWIDDNGSGWQLNNVKPSKTDWIIDTWYHIAVVRTGNLIKIFIDGIEYTSNSYTYQVQNPSSIPIYFGRSQLSNRNHNGKIDDIRIYNIAHNEIELQNIINNELTGNEIGLLGYWNCNETSGNIAYDQSTFNNYATLYGDAAFVSSNSPLTPPNGNMPFSPVSPTGIPYNIVITNLLIDGMQPGIGSQIGVFDDTLCVGAITYSNSGNMQLIAWQGDQNQNLAGFTPGDTMIFKLYTNWYSNIEIFEAVPTYVQGNGTFGNGSFAVVDLNISTGLSPDVSISDTLLNFNALEINTSLNDTVIITNNGNANLQILNISTSLSDFTTNVFSGFLLPGQSDTIIVTFTPTSVAIYQETLTIETDHPTQSIIEIELYGTGLPTATPQISVTPSYLNFGNIAVNTSVSLNINVNNSGNGDLSVTNITSSNSAFSVIGNTFFTLGQNGNQDVEIQFSPTSLGVFSGSVTVFSNDGDISIPIGGIVTDGHFTSVQPTGLPYNIIVQNAEVQGFNIEIGDEIAAFDDTLCVGVSNSANGKSASFDGSGDYIEIPDDSNWDFGSGDFSVSLWANPSSFSSNNTYIEIGHWSNSFIIRQNSSSSLYVYMWNSSYSYSYNPSLNQWFHITVRRMNGILNLFINGNQIGNSYNCTHNFQPSNVVRIGSSVHTSGQYFNGNIDEVRIWNYARSQTEIQSDMNNKLLGNESGLVGYWNFDNNSANDLTSNGNHGTFYGNTYIENESPISADHNIVAWQEDLNQSLTGFTIGDTMNFKIWTNIYNTDVEVDAQAVYIIGDGTFGFGQYSVLNLSGDAGIEPDISVSSNYVYVGQVEMNQSVTADIVIYNNGNALLEVDLSDNSDSYTHNISNALINAGDSLIVSITFSPTFAGNHSGVLTILSDDPDTYEIPVSLDGFALPVGIANGTVSTTELNFGNVNLNDTATLSFNVINIGTAPLQISSITSINGAFTINPTSFSLQNTNDNQEVFINFVPTTVQAYNSTITISTNAGNLTLSANGLGFDGYFVPVVSTGLPYTIVIQNTNLTEFWEVGDEIAVFDDTICVGVVAISSLTGNIQLTAWQADPTLNLAGFTSGDTMQFKSWTEINGFPCEFNANATYILGDGTFGYGQYSVVELSFITPEISVNPMEFFVALDEPDSSLETLSITNSGIVELDYNISHTHNNDNIIGNSLLLDGDNDYLSVSSQYNNLDQTTLEAWIYPMGLSGHQWIFSNGRDCCTPNGGFNFYYNGANLYCSVWRSSDNQMISINAPNVITQNEWQHVSMKYDGFQLFLYVNGNEVISSIVYSQSSILNGSNSLHMGVLAYSVPTYYDYYGMIDEVRIWDIARTESEIADNYTKSLSGNELGLLGYWNFDDTTTTDLTVNGNNGILNGDASITEINAPIVNWLSISNLTGIVPPLGTTNIMLDINSTGLIDGLYETELVIDNNTLHNSPVIIPISLNVTGNAQIAASPDNLIFSEIIVGETETLSIQIQNIGTDVLHIDSVFNSPAQFQLTNLIAFPDSISPLAYATLEVTFAPISDGLFLDTLYILSDASNFDTLLITLLGTGLTPPNIEVQNTSWTDTLTSGIIETDTFYIANSGQANLVFSINNTISWLSLIPSSGSVPVNDSLAIVLNISTIGVYAGVYTNSFSIISNDLTNPEIIFNLDLNVLGSPELTVVDNINFGTVDVGTTGNYSLILENSGTDTLFIDSIELSSLYFANSGQNSFFILPGQTDTLPLEFSPSLSILYSGILTVYSNASNIPVKQIVLQGMGNLPQDISLLPDSINITMTSGSAQSQNITISNDGGQDLNYSISIDNPAKSALSLDGTGDYLNIINTASLNPDTAITIEAWIYPNDDNQEFIVAKEYSSVGTYRLWINEDGKYQFTLNNSKTVVSSSLATIGNWTHIAASCDGSKMQIFINGILDAELIWYPFTISANTANLRIGRSHLNEYFDGYIDELRIWDVARNESEIQSVMNQSLLGTETGLVLYYKFDESSGNIAIDESSNSNNGTFYGNSSRTNSGINFNNFLSLSSNSGTVGAMSSQTISADFDANNLIANIFEQNINVSSNDPDEPLLTIPVSLNVTGLSSISASTLALNFANTYIGQSDTLAFTVSNNGAERIIIGSWNFSNNDFSVSLPYTEIYPLSEKNVEIYFSPSSSGVISETLSLMSDAANIPNLEISLNGLGLDPPIVSVDTSMFSSVLNWGNSETQYLTIYNSGDGAMNWDLAGFDSNWLTLSDTIGVVPAHDSVIVSLDFNGTNDGGTYTSNLLLNTNDYTNPQLNISVSLEINGALFSIDVNQLSNYVTFEEFKTDTFIILNTGIGPLDFTLSESVAWLSLNSYSGTIPIGENDTIIVTYDGNFAHGTYITNIDFITNDPSNLTFNLPVSLEILHATLVSIPSTLNFGYAVKDIGETLNFTLLNNGNVDITIDSLYSVAPFSPDANYAGFFLAAGSSIDIPIFFMPAALLTYSELLTVETSVGIFNFPLEGIGEQAQAAWSYSWSDWDFGLVDIMAGATKNLVIYNTGNIPFTMDDWNLSNDIFTISDTIFTIGVGQSKTIEVGFNPDTVGIFEGVILWTVNSIGTKELLLDGRGFYLSQAPILTYVDDIDYGGTNGVYPLIGNTSQYFEYKVIYTDADNNPPMIGYPIVGIDKNGDADFLDSGEDEILMYEVDASDNTYTDGKTYSFVTTLPLNQLLGYSFFAYDSLGNQSIGEGVNYRSDPLVSNDMLDISIYANDINFSDLTPAVGQEITITATVHNNSDYPASNISVKFYEEDSFLVELFIPYLSGQSQSNVSINHVFPIDEYYPIKVVIDEQNFLIEDNELNNFAIRPVLVGEFSIPGQIVVTAGITPSTVSPWGTLHYYGHADYVNSYDPNSNVAGALVTMTVPATGITYTSYTNANGDFDIYFSAPGDVGTYAVNATVTDFTLLANAPTVYFTVFVPNEIIWGPDLAITYWWGTDIHWTSECRRIGEPIDVTAYVTNIGNVTAYQVFNHIFQDNNLIFTETFDSIPPGTNKVINFTVTYNTVGYHSVSVDIDPNDVIAELSEWNNYGSKTRYIYPLEADLNPNDIWFSDNSPLEGQPINMTFSIRNLQCTYSDITDANIYHIYGTDTTKLATLPVDQISSFGYDYLYLYNQVFTDLGWHYILIEVDSADLVVETNEFNNSYMEGFYVEQAIADLTISDISFSAYNPDMGDLINFTATVWNNGTADADSFYVRYYIDGTQLSDSILIEHLPSFTNILITSDPWLVADCEHLVSATVDEDDFILETNEYNNYTERRIGYDFVPSLYPYYYSSNINVLVGSTVTLKSRIYNNGTFDADTVFVSYLIDGVLEHYDGIPLINHQSYSGSQVLHTFPFTGDYVVKIWADMIYPDSTRYCEWDENNNWTYLYVHVYGEDPDLEVLSQHISPTELNPDPDEVVNIFGSFTNNGNVATGPFYVRFYVNSVQLGDSVYVSGLLAHEDSTVACTDSFSSPLIGTHVIRVTLDEVEQQVQEYNELNNEASRAIIVGDAPDMMFSDAGGIWLSDTFPDIGDQIIINGVVENNGGATGTANLNYYVIYDLDTTWITTVQFIAAPYDSIDVPINWNVTVPYGRIYLTITNCTPDEFNTFNNTEYLDFGTPLPSIIADISSSSNAICLGDTVQLSASASGGSGSFLYSWTSSPAGFSSTSQNITVVPNVSTTYSVLVDDGYHTTTASFYVNVSNVIVNLGSDISLCDGETATLDPGYYASFLWSDSSISQTIVVSDNGNYSVTVTDGFGCTDSDGINIYVYPNPEIDLGADTTICEGSVLTLNPGNFTSYLWTTQETTQTIDIADAGIFSVFVTDINGCTASDIIELSVIPLSVYLGSDTSVCEAENVILDAGVFSSYLWSTQETTQTISAIFPGVYSLTVTDTTGCSNSDEIIITVNSLPAVDLGANVELCEGEFAILSGGQFANYLWSEGGTNQTISVNEADMYFLTVTDGFACENVDSVEVFVNPLPDLYLGEDIEICNGSAATIDAGVFDSYLWSNQETTQTIDVQLAGTYFVVVSDTNDCEASDTIMVSSVSVIVDLGADTTICQGESVVLDAGIYQDYLWSNQETTQSIAVSVTGTYSLTISDTSGCSVSDEIIITVNPLPAVDLGNDLDICEGSFATLNGGQFASYLWSDGGTDQTITVNETDTYYLTVSDGFACTNNDSVEVFVHALPIVNLGADIEICEASYETLDAGVFDTYLWSTQETTQTIDVEIAGTFIVFVTDTNACTNSDTIIVSIIPLSVDLGNDIEACDGIFINLNAGVYSSYLWSTQETTQEIVVNTSGIYSLTVTDTTACSNSDDIEIVLNPLPNVNLGNDLTVCEGDNVTLSGGQFATYFWSNGSTQQSLTTNITGTYYLTVTDGNGCLNYDNISVFTNPLPNVSFAGLQASYCPYELGDSLFGNPVGGSFSGPAIFGDYFYPPGTNPGIYEIIYSYTDIYNCTNSDTQSVEIFSLPNVSFTGLSSLYFDNDPQDTLIGSPSGGIFNGSGMSSNVFSPASSGVGYFTISYVYADSNTCISTAVQSVTVTSAFSLDGQLHYDNLNLTAMPNSKVYLFDNLGIVLDSSQTGTDGEFVFDQLINGNYSLTASTELPFGGINATDALLIQRHIVYIELLDGLKLEAADVNLSSTISSLDALLVLRRTVGYISSFDAGDWIFENPEIIINNADFTEDFAGLCLGDVNASNTYSSSKNLESSLTLINDRTINVSVGEYFDLPISSTNSLDLGAFTLILSYSGKLCEVVEISSKAEGMLYNVVENEIRIAWSNAFPIHFNENEEILSIKMLRTENTESEPRINLSYESEFADENATVLQGIAISVPSIKTVGLNSEFSLSHNCPNPFSNITNIKYELPEFAHVKLVVQNMLGEQIAIIVNEEQQIGKYEVEFDGSSYASGIYLYKIYVEGESNNYSETKKMNIFR
ncbi:MAG: choice-of-anchor D domain-containing protein [Bacteroidetes bacterium]|jgi:hypothetical protein|nr:choice-of-anchor D domain-containing protein [Bacteroidota bacterium]MBT7142514.1 choice-of-anchor D domain-containing protein [Bacteroidota bacterium]MBT7490720.1 choice-of-anchor D domain-containing protein [Bacteroidota bacterium]